MATEPERPGENTSEENDEDFDSDAALASAAGESNGSDADDEARGPGGSAAKQAAPARSAASPHIGSSPELWGMANRPCWWSLHCRCVVLATKWCCRRPGGA